MKIYEAQADRQTLDTLIALSKEWEKEGSCNGYRANEDEDILGNRIFLAEEDGKIIGYLFGHEIKAEKMSSVIEDGQDCFEIMEIYVRRQYRNKGIGKKLFDHCEKHIDSGYITLTCAAKNWKQILHFYIEELDMCFHYAGLYKKIK